MAITKLTTVRDVGKYCMTGFDQQLYSTRCIVISSHCRSLLSLVQWLQHDPKYLSLLASQLPGPGAGQEASHTATTLTLLLALETSSSEDGKGIDTIRPDIEGTVFPYILHVQFFMYFYLEVYLISNMYFAVV